MSTPRRAIDPRIVRRVCRLVQQKCDEQFDTRVHGWQTRAAALLGITQPMLSVLYSGSGAERGISVSTLIRLRSWLGMSLDDILGLSPLDAANRSAG